MERGIGYAVKGTFIYIYIYCIGGVDAINIVVANTVCVSETKRVADKELWDVFGKQKKKKPKR